MVCSCAQASPVKNAMTHFRLAHQSKKLRMFSPCVEFMIAISYENAKNSKQPLKFVFYSKCSSSFVYWVFKANELDFEGF